MRAATHGINQEDLARIGRLPVEHLREWIVGPAPQSRTTRLQNMNLSGGTNGISGSSGAYRISIPIDPHQQCPIPKGVVARERGGELLLFQEHFIDDFAKLSNVF